MLFSDVKKKFLIYIRRFIQLNFKEYCHARDSCANCLMIDLHFTLMNCVSSLMTVIGISKNSTSKWGSEINSIVKSLQKITSNVEGKNCSFARSFRPFVRFFSKRWTAVYPSNKARIGAKLWQNAVQTLYNFSLSDTELFCEFFSPKF